MVALYTWLLNGITKAGNAVGKTVHDGIVWLLTGIRDLFDGLKNWIWDSIWWVLDFLKDFFFQWAFALYDGLMNGLAAVKNAIPGIDFTNVLFWLEVINAYLPIQESFTFITVYYTWNVGVAIFKFVVRLIP